jgi:hypothetical protein
MPNKTKKRQQKKKRVAKQSFSKAIAAPAALSKSTVARTPKFIYKNDGRTNSVTITHAEYFYTVGTPAGTAPFFVCESFAVNPGNTTMFPWLSTQAFAWERYRFKKLHFRYVPRCSTAQAGTLVLSPDYDADDDPPPNELVACSYADAVTSVPWSETVLRCNPEACLGGMKTKYIRVGALKQNADIKMYDACNLFVCRDSANSTAVTWGKLWVEYTVELITPHTLPVPLTSVYAATSTSGVVPNYPVPPDNGSVIGAVVDKAGPINITANENISGGGASGWDISGLIPGMRYVLQAVARSGGPEPWYYSYATPTITGGTVLKNYRPASGYEEVSAANIRTLLTDVLVQATSSVMSVLPNWSTTESSLLSGSQLMVSPVVSDSAFTFL